MSEVECIRSIKELLGVIKKLSILISVVVTWMSTVAKTQAEYFKWRILFILCCSKVDRGFGNTYDFHCNITLIAKKIGENWLLKENVSAIIGPLPSEWQTQKCS